MDHQELNENATLDDEIVRLLAIDPSPEFVATIRTRVALDGAPRIGVRSWMVGIMVAGAVAAMVVMAVRVGVPARRPGAVPLLISRTVQTGTVTPVIETSNALTVPAPARTGVDADRRKPAASTPAPEILVDPREAHAIRAFIDEAVGGRIDRSAMSETLTSPRLESAPVQELFIAPIQLLPLAGDEGRKP